MFMRSSGVMSLNLAVRALTSSEVACSSLTSSRRDVVLHLDLGRLGFAPSGPGGRPVVHGSCAGG